MIKSSIIENIYIYIDPSQLCAPRDASICEKKKIKKKKTKVDSEKCTLFVLFLVQ